MNGIVKVLAKVLLTVVELASPELVKQLKTFAIEFQKKCNATPNPWDDILAEVIVELLSAKQV